MSGIRAAIYKDWKLFLKNAGLLTLVLPFVLLMLMRIGMSDLSSAQYIRPFVIGVRDEDQTIMSKSLIEQMRRVEFFGDVIVLSEDDADEEALEQGAAAVFTIPADFFYDAYTGIQQPVRVTLNSTRRPEAAVFRMIFTSVMDIMREGQAAEAAVYGFCYPEPDEAVLNQMHADGSARLLENTLRRNGAFARNTSQTDIAGALIRRVAAAAFAFLAVFEASAVFRTIPEEKRRGIRSRFQAVGGGGSAFLLSRSLLLAVILAPAYLAMWLILCAGGAVLSGAAAGYILFCVLFTAGVSGMMLGFLNVSGDGAAAARYASWYLLLGLMLGGTLIPASSLPRFLHDAIRLFPTGCAMYVFSGLGRGIAASGILRVMTPFLAVSLVFFLLSLPVRLFAERESTSRRAGGRSSGRASGAGRETMMASRYFGMSAMKFRKMTGGLFGIFCLLAVSLGAGACVFGAFSGAGETIRIAVTEEEESTESKQFIELLRDMGNIEVLPETAEEAALRLLDGTVEGSLTIRRGFSDYVKGTGDAVSSGDSLHVLAYESAAASFSAQGMREIVSGQTMVLRTRNGIKDWAEGLLGHTLSSEETKSLEARMESEEEKKRKEGAFYEIRWSEGAAAADPFVPRPEAFAALTILFAVLSSSVWCGRRDNRSAERRLLSARGGTLLSYGTDFFALIMTGGTAAAGYGLPWILRGQLPTVQVLLSGAGYLAVTALLALFFVRNTGGEGGTDALTSFLALALCILGGCFLDLRDTLPVMSKLSEILPPGLLLYRGERGIGFAAAAALLFFLGAGPGRFRQNH
ncbi:MAG: ABC transporter permease [Clostridium sp.]|nr:ABC transporter permease [Clostridium sp.]